MKSTSSLLEQALEYQARGWSVIPIRPRGKIPLIQWAEYQTRQATEAEVRQWWATWPAANIGIITGKISGMVVVDVDTKHGGNPKPIHDTYPTASITRTGSGGFHLLYEYPADATWVPNSASVRKGIDVRADGGYIVAPPSIHESGGVYSWVNAGAKGGIAPNFVFARGTDEATPATISEDGKWLTKILTKVAKGQRNDSMTRLVGYLAAKQIPIDVCARLVDIWAVSALEEPGSFTQEERSATITSVYQRQKQKELHIPTQSQTDRKLDFKTWKDFLRKYGGLEVSWLVKDWMPDSTIGFAVAPPGSYKTWMAMDLAVSVATGLPFMGGEVTRPGPVIIMQQEDFHGQTADRLASILLSKVGVTSLSASDEDVVLPPLPSPPIYIESSRSFRFDEQAPAQQLIDMVAKIKPVLVVIDPLYSTISTDEYMASAVERMFMLKTLRDAYGTSFLIVHHTKKSTSGDRLDIWGSQFLNAFLETGWQIRPTDIDKRVTVSRHFKIAENPPSVDLHFSIGTGAAWEYRVEQYKASRSTEAEPKSRNKNDIMGDLI